MIGTEQPAGQRGRLRGVERVGYLDGVNPFSAGGNFPTPRTAQVVINGTGLTMSFL